MKDWKGMKEWMINKKCMRVMEIIEKKIINNMNKIYNDCIYIIN